MDINLSEIAALVNAGKGPNYFEDRLERSFVPLFDKLESIREDKTPFKVSDLFSTDNPRFAKLQKRYEKAISAFITGFEHRVGVGEKKEGVTATKTHIPLNSVSLDNVSPKVLDKLKGVIMAFGGGEKKGFKTEDETHAAMPVHIQSIDNDVLKSMGAISSDKRSDGLKAALGNKRDDSSSGGKFSILKWLAKTGLAVGALAAGAALLFEGFMTDGKLKGTLKVIGSALIKPAAMIIDGLLKGIIKPILSVGGNAIKGIFNVITKMMPKSLLNFASGAFKLTGLKALGKLGGKGSIFLFKRLPILGTLVSFGFAYSRFRDGDNLGGMLEVAAGIAAIFPVVGTAISAGIGVFLALRDMKTTRVQRQTGGNMLNGISEWFKNNKFFKSVADFFGGLFGLFTAKSGTDVDDAVAKIKNGGMFILAPVISSIVGLFDFFRNGDATRFIKNTGEMFSNFGEWFGEMFSNFWGKMVGYIGNMLSHIEDSNFFKGLKTNFKIFIQSTKIKVSNVFNKLIDLINIIPKAINGLVNYQIDRWNNIVENSDLIPDFLKVGRFSLADDGVVGRIDTSSMEKELSNLISEREKLAATERKRLEDKARKDREDAERRRFEESVNMHNANAAAIVGAINSQNGVIAATAAHNAPQRPNMVINNIDNNDSTRRVRQSIYVDNYIPVPTN